MIKKKQLREKLQDRSAAQRGDVNKAAAPLTAPSAAPATENNAYNDHHRYGGGNLSQSVNL